jgi:hypothetical protein
MSRNFRLYVEILVNLSFIFFGLGKELELFDWKKNNEKKK